MDQGITSTKMIMVLLPAQSSSFGKYVGNMARRNIEDTFSRLWSLQPLTRTLVRKFSKEAICYSDNVFGLIKTLLQGHIVCTAVITFCAFLVARNFSKL